jgi:hypothetical protein
MRVHKGFGDKPKLAANVLDQSTRFFVALQRADLKRRKRMSDFGAIQSVNYNRDGGGTRSDYDRDSFTATATKDRAPESGELMYSLLGGITPEGWVGVFSKTGSTESGFLSRLNIVGTERTGTVPTLIKPDFTSLRRRFLPMLAALEHKEVVLNPSDESVARMGEWF